MLGSNIPSWAVKNASAACLPAAGDFLARLAFSQLMSRPLSLAALSLGAGLALRGAAVSALVVERRVTAVFWLVRGCGRPADAVACVQTAPRATSSPTCASNRSVL